MDNHQKYQEKKIQYNKGKTLTEEEEEKSKFKKVNEEGIENIYLNKIKDKQYSSSYEKERQKMRNEVFLATKDIKSKLENTYMLKTKKNSILKKIIKLRITG